MITVIPAEDGTVDVETTLRQPGVYLDQWALADFARGQARRERFLAVFKTKGTLLFSWTSAVDLSGPQQPDTVANIREFLVRIGPHWVPLELNPWKTTRKESGEEPCSGTPCVSESFLRAYYPLIHEGPLDLGTVVDLIHNDREAVQRELEQLKAGADARVRDYRGQFIAVQDQMRKDDDRWAHRDQRANLVETALDRVLAPLNDPGRPMASLLRALERVVIREAKSHTWMPNDGVDFMHAAVAGGCADFLLLDREWKRRVLEVAPPRAHPWVFYEPELANFLDVFERCVVAPA